MVFSSDVSTPLDESNVRKAFNRVLDTAELHRRGPHQMRHTFASLLLAAGEPITYVSQQLGHRDPSITLRVNSHWMPDTSTRKGVDRLDDALPNVAQAWPDTIAVNDGNERKSFVSNGEPGGNRTRKAKPQAEA
jgi:integrase